MSGRMECVVNLLALHPSCKEPIESIWKGGEAKLGKWLNELTV